MGLRALSQALREFSAHERNQAHQATAREGISVVMGDSPRQWHLSLPHALDMAADELDRRNIEALRFRALLKAMRERGMEDTYLILMREPMPKEI